MPPRVTAPVPFLSTNTSCVPPRASDTVACHARRESERECGAEVAKAEQPRSYENCRRSSITSAAHAQPAAAEAKDVRGSGLGGGGLPFLLPYLEGRVPDSAKGSQIFQAELEQLFSTGIWTSVDFSRAKHTLSPLSYPKSGGCW